jgi:predicted transcriptional regulator
MDTVVLEVSDLTEGLEAFRRAWASGETEAGARISFASPELLWRTLTAKRWELLRTMTGQGPLGLREIAGRVGRDVKVVHTDVHALTSAGILHRAETGKFEFPYDAVRVDFMLRAA